MANYDIIKKDSLKEYPVEPLNEINPRFLRIPEISFNYSSESFGNNREDIVLPVKHAVGILRKVIKNSDGSIRLSLDYRQQLVGDFKNYLKCLSIDPMETEYTRMFMEALFFAGIFSEVFECISDYYSDLYYKGTRSANDVALLDYADLYLKVADYLLFKTNDYSGANKAYALLGIDWTDVIEREKLYANPIANEWRRKASLYSDITKGELIGNTGLFDDIGQPITRLYNRLLVSETKSDNSSLIDYCGEIIRLVNSSNDIDCKRLGFFVIESIRSHYCVQILYQYQFDIEKKKNPKISTDDIIWFSRYLPKSISGYVPNMEKGKLKEQILSFVSIFFSMNIIQNTLRVDDDFKGTAYYTSLNTFSLMLPYKCLGSRLSECGKLAVMHVSYMNDPTEGQILKEMVFQKYEKKAEGNERIQANVPYVFVKCFTGLPDYLPMWNMYGDSAKGVSILMDWDSDSRKQLFRVCYVADKKRINKTDNPGIDVDEINKQIRFIRRQIRRNKSPQFMNLAYEILDSICFLFKSSSYGYEKEMRMIYQFDGVSDSFIHTEKEGKVLMYVNPDVIIPIREIILGPKFEDAAMRIPYLQEQLDKMSEINHTKPIKISMSSIDYR